MLIADGGGGYGGTDWMSTDVRFMWSTIAGQETDAHFNVVDGWRKTADLTLAHLGQVQMYRENLASVWPPKKSPASAAYLARLDKLIAHLQETHDAASANYTAFSTVTLTLSLARTKLKPIFDEYMANEQLNLHWKEKQDAAAQKSASPTPTPSPSPGPSPSSQTPPVSTERQQQLTNQARVIMYDLSNTVLSGQAALKKPKPYDPSGTKDETGHEKSDIDIGSGFSVPPVIPAPGANGVGTSGSASAPLTHSNVTPAHSPPANPVNPNPVIGTPGSGPVLGGVGPTPVITPPALTQPPVPSPSPIPAPTPPGFVPGIIGPGSSTGLTPSGALLPNGGGKLPPSGMPKPGLGTGPAGRLAMPSGGVIGATPGSGMIGQVPPTGTRARASGPARANPVGGVIGQQGNGLGGRTGPSTGQGAGSPNTPLANQAGQRRVRRDDGTEATTWDPDNPWVTDEGVDPVVLPPDTPGPINPGPAIGYPR